MNNDAFRLELRLVRLDGGVLEDEDIVSTLAQCADSSYKPQTGTSQQDQGNRANVMLVQPLLRGQAGETEHVGSGLLDGGGHTLCEGAHDGRCPLDTEAPTPLFGWGCSTIAGLHDVNP